jgi:hypothetical protein
LASEKGHVGVVKLLLEYGAKIDAIQRNIIESKTVCIYSSNRRLEQFNET